MPLSLEDLDDPLFLQLPPEEQMKGRREVFQYLTRTDPMFRSLPTEERRKVLFPIEIEEPSIMEPIKETGKELARLGIVGGSTLLGLGAGTVAAPFTGPAAPVMPYVGASLGAAGGETLAQYIFDPKMRPKMIALQAALGLIPGLKIPSITSQAGRAALRASEGAAMTGLATAGSAALEGKAPSAGEMFKAMLIGALIGAPLGAREAIKRRPKLTPEQQGRVDAIAKELDQLDYLRQSPEGRRLLSQQLAEQEAKGKIEAEFAELRRGALPEKEPSPPTKTEATRPQDIVLAEEAGVMFTERLALPPPKIEIIRSALKKEAAGEKLTSQEKQTIREATEKTAPPKVKEQLTPEQQRKVDEFEAKRREIIEDARRILADPNAADYTKQAALEKLDELGVKPPKPTEAGAKQAPVEWLGWQEVPGREPMPLWNLTRDVGEHPKGSTISPETIRKLGFEPPEPPEPAIKPTIKKPRPKFQKPPEPETTPFTSLKVSEMGRQPSPMFERTPAGEQAVIPGAEGRQVPKGALRAKATQTEAPAELEYKGKTYTKAVKEEEGVKLIDDKDVVLKKAEDILSVEEKIPFEVPKEEPGVPPVGERVAGREAIAPAGDLSKVPLKELIKKGFGEETGAVGELTPEQRAVAKAAREARREIYRRVGRYAKESGKSVAEAAEELGVSKTMALQIERQNRESIRTPEVIYAKRQGTPVSIVDQVKPGDIVYDHLLGEYGWVKGAAGKDAIRLASGNDQWTVGVGNRLELAERVGTKELLRKALGSEVGTIGELSPEQARLEADARLARKELYQRINLTAKQTGRDFIDVAQEAGLSRPLATRLVLTRGLDDAVEALGSAAEGIKRLNEKSAMILSEHERVMEKGTLSKELYAEMREKFGPEGETYARQISERGIDEGRILVDEAAKRVLKAVADLERFGDGLSVATAKAARQTLDAVVKEAQKDALSFRKDLAAWGRIGQALQRRPRQMFSDDTIAALERIGIMIDLPRKIKMRLPIDTQIYNSLKSVITEKSWNALTPEQQRQFQSNLVDTFRLNLFAPTSFTLDAGFNLTELGVQATSGLVGDLVHVGRGALKGELYSMPSLQGMWRAIQLRKQLFTETNPETIAKLKSRWMVPEVEAGTRRTFGGEPVPSELTLGEAWTTMGRPGAFTERGNIYSAAYDAIKGTPMYAKAAVDTGVGRMAANMVLWREGFMQADKRGLKGLDRQNFLEEYWRDLPQRAVDMAIEEANRAKANRPLTKWEESFARNKAVQLFIEAFGRWTFQFPRWAAEMVGYNPKLWKKFTRMESSPEEVARYLTRMTTGIGGIYFIDQMFNNNPEGHVDYNSAEWVDRDGNRKRLSGRDQIIMPLFLAQIARAGWKASTGQDATDEIAKVTGLARYVSIFGLRALYGEGGVLGRITREFSQSMRYQGKFDSRSLSDGMTDSLNRMLPGQAVLGAVKSIFDPVVREGIGANLPGVSLLKEPAIDLATGESLEPRQRYFGIEGPSLLGTPIPGATRMMPEASKLLSRYGLLTYRGPRMPIAGYRASEAPEEVTREWEIEFGRARNRIFSQLIPSIEAAEVRVTSEQMRPNAPFYERIRKMIQRYDSIAMRHATNIVNRRHLTRGRLPRQPTVRERRAEIAEGG